MNQGPFSKIAIRDNEGFRENPRGTNVIYISKLGMEMEIRDRDRRYHWRYFKNDSVSRFFFHHSNNKKKRRYCWYKFLYDIALLIPELKFSSSYSLITSLIMKAEYFVKSQLRLAWMICMCTLYMFGQFFFQPFSISFILLLLPDRSLEIHQELFSINITMGFNYIRV